MPAGCTPPVARILIRPCGIPVAKFASQLPQLDANDAAMIGNFKPFIVAALTCWLVAQPALAAEPPPSPSTKERAERALKEGVARIMRALELLIQSVPQYEMPEVLDNGDIIIRRKPKRNRPQPENPEVDETRT